MANNFLWGALGSAGASLAWSTGGWGAVCAVGGAVAAIALVAWGVEHVGLARRREDARAGTGAPQAETSG